ncbi:MAG: CotH kinase family protein, partial [Flavobacteriales bacterium]|nr:CotH kinase family protein [Flavobacteriales bacterium]
MASHPNEEVWYGLDGKHPDTPLTGPIQLDSTRVIEFETRGPDRTPSHPVGGLYLIDPPHDLPVVSLHCPPEFLFDPEIGIYVEGNDADSLWPYFGANFWERWTRIAAMSYFEDGNEYIHQDVEIQIHGGKAARTQAQKPFRITARNALGTGTLNHQFIKTQENNQYKKIVLRNSGGDFNRFHFRDAFLHNLMIEDTLDIDLNAAEPCVLYLNGQYWGVMNIREKIGKSYIKETYGVVDDADITILEEDTAIVFGTREEFDSMIEWIEQTDFSQAQNYDSLEQLVDVKSFADYIIAETYWNNTDWPANNLKYWTREGGKWRFILFDLDVSLNTFGWVSEETDNLGRIIDDFQFIKTVKIFTALLENAEWKHHFVNRYADLMNTAFEAEHVKKELYNLVDYVEPEMYRHFELYPNSVFWWNLYDIDDLTVRFIDGRPSFARDYVEEAMEL